MLDLLISYAIARSDGRRFWLKLLNSTAHAVYWLIDSGAFSAKNSGHVITFEEYAGFMREVQDLPMHGCIQLDVVGDHDASMQNLARHVELGQVPIPVLTAFAPLRAMHELRDVNRRICIAGGTMALAHLGWYVSRVNQSHELLSGDCELHGLGFTKGVQPMTRTRIKTVDSSTWSTGQRFGRMFIFDEDRGVIGQCYWKDVIENGWRGLPKKTQDLMVSAGFAVEELQGRNAAVTRGAWSYWHLASMAEALRYARYMKKRGVQVFLAMAGRSSVESVILALKLMSDDGRFRWDLGRRATKVSIAKIRKNLLVELVEASSKFQAWVES